jgi:hypothetical protein
MTTNRTVTVACKLPHGLIIRDFVKVTEQEPAPGGYRVFEVFKQTGPRYRLKGPAPAEARGSLFIRSIEVVGGYAITEGIPADVFERFIDANKNSAFIVNQLIYGHEDGRRVRSWARDRESLRTGFEPLDVTLKSHRGTFVHADERIPRIRGTSLVVD